jgi:hypothetical protein
VEFPGENVVSSTARGLTAPRRLGPIVAVLVPLLFIQWRFSHDPLALPLGGAMCAAFLMVAPALWRWLFPLEPRGDESERIPRWLRLAIYLTAGVVVVFGIGRAVPHALGMAPTFMTAGSSLLVSTALFWVGGWGLARDIDHEAHLAHERARAKALEREAQHAQLLALRSHLDPHFLFNTLNAIAEWCRSDGAVAEKALLQLSRMLRTIMEGIKVAEWPLARDLELVDALFSLYLVRDPEMFEYVRDVPSPLPDVAVPPMLLLPIAENAMKHGPAAGRRGKVRLRIAMTNDAVVVEIENPGEYRGPREGGSGLDIVQKRLALTYAERASFQIRGEEGHTLAQLVLPAPSPRDT